MYNIRPQFSSDTLARVLLVENSNALRTVFRILLSTDHQVEILGEAESEEEALGLIPRLKPNLVLIDLELNDGSGVELVRQIRKLYPKLKILVLSANEDEVITQEIIASGVNAYCVKGLPIIQLIDIIHHVQDGDIWIDPTVLSNLNFDDPFSDANPAWEDSLSEEMVYPNENFHQKKTRSLSNSIFKRF